MRYKNKIIFDNRFVIYVDDYHAQIGLILELITELSD